MIDQRNKQAEAEMAFKNYEKQMTPQAKEENEALRNERVQSAYRQQNEEDLQNRKAYDALSTPEAVRHVMNSYLTHLEDIYKSKDSAAWKALMMPLWTAMQPIIASGVIPPAVMRGPDKDVGRFPTDLMTSRKIARDDKSVISDAAQKGIMPLQ